VLGVMADKDVAGVLRAFADGFDEVVATQNSTSRSMPAADLAELAGAFWPAGRVHTEPDLAAAIVLARRLAGAGDDGGSGGAGVVVTGSVVTAGEARTIVARSLPSGA